MREPGLSGRTFCLRLPLKEGFPIIHCNTCGRSKNLTGFKNSGLKSPGMKSLGLKGPGLKLGVEKSGVCLWLPLKEGFPIIHCNTCGRS